MKRGTERTRQIDAEIGRRLRLFREMKGITQVDLAGRVGLTFQQIQKYERAQNRISCSKLVEIADALDIGLQDFFEEILEGERTKLSNEELILIANIRKQRPDIRRNLCKFLLAI